MLEKHQHKTLSEIRRTVSVVALVIDATKG
jgi:hypothetical protein